MWGDREEDMVGPLEEYMKAGTLHCVRGEPHTCHHFVWEVCHLCFCMRIRFLLQENSWRVVGPMDF
jgi:hypothetical protein